ncbi:CpaF family protein (plasmid) [Pseudoduganella sp. UC29_106]|uniref:CpaF family protein n=1 Tax=Pseudoduganella sp. UC29_106 TaxID=3374553 RepID=UPI003756952A
MSADLQNPSVVAPAMVDTAESLAQYYLRPIAHFFQDPAVTSIAINRFDHVMIRKNGMWEVTEAKFADEKTLVRAITQVIGNLGQHIDAETAPIADARLADGSRVNAVLAPTAHRGSNMTIRIFPKVRYTVRDLLDKGALNGEMLRFFELAAACQYNILVSGATGSGKTTILNAIANLIPDEHRIGVIEDTAELKIDKPNLVGMEAPRRALKPGERPITMEDLLVNTLRQELATVIVGEVREPKASTALMLALNTGHKGVISSLHANSADHARTRLINMLLSNDTRIPYDAIKHEIDDNFDMVIQCEHTPKHGKRIVSVHEFQDGQLNPLFTWDYIKGEHKQAYIASQRPPRLFNIAKKYGLSVG